MFYLVVKRKMTICLMYVTNRPNNRRRYKRSPEAVSSTYETAGRLQCRKSTAGRMLEKILDRYSLLCLDEKEETYYRAYGGCKSTIDITLANIMIALEYLRSKEYDFRGSDHFPIFIDEKEVFTKQQ